MNSKGVNIRDQPWRSWQNGLLGQGIQTLGAVVYLPLLFRAAGRLRPSISPIDTVVSSVRDTHTLTPGSPAPRHLILSYMIVACHIWHATKTSDT